MSGAEVINISMNIREVENMSRKKMVAMMVVVMLGAGLCL
jgi:hypothetical protein